MMLWMMLWMMLLLLAVGELNPFISQLSKKNIRSWVKLLRQRFTNLSRAENRRMKPKGPLASVCTSARRFLFFFFSEDIGVTGTFKIKKIVNLTPPKLIIQSQF